MALETRVGKTKVLTVLCSLFHHRFRQDFFGKGLRHFQPTFLCADDLVNAYGDLSQVMMFPQISGFGRPSRILCPSIFLIRHIGYDGEVIQHTHAPQKSILMFHDLIDDMLRAVFHQVSYILPTPPSQ